MKVGTIRLKTSEDVSLVCAILNTYTWDVDAVCGRYCVDGKSVIALFMLLDSDIDIYLHCSVPSMHEEMRKELEEWLVKR